MPEYIWAFLLLFLLGPTAWPAVLALAIHNAGILGKLASEVVEDLEARLREAARPTRPGPPGGRRRSRRRRPGDGQGRLVELEPPEEPA